MSIEMQNAYTSDMAVINENGETEHVDCVDEDNQSETPINEPENIVDIDAAQYDEETLNDDEFAELLGE